MFANQILENHKPPTIHVESRTKYKVDDGELNNARHRSTTARYMGVTGNGSLRRRGREVLSDIVAMGYDDQEWEIRLGARLVICGCMCLNKLVRWCPAPWAENEKLMGVGNCSVSRSSLLEPIV